ncbi:MAG: hypothetical protein LBS70_07885 [Candidatus Accumulibacter sp.]|jgi:hypothetical protein|nr:hypothetical protein [Accumulibacter sp.]
MKTFYALFAAAALSLFAWAQYKGYGLLDETAARQAAARPGTHSIFHK